MKKFILLSLIIAFPVVLSAAFSSGPRVDYKGKSSNSGKTLHKWFQPYVNYDNNDWENNCFRENNKELIEWEIEKMLKEKIFKMDFFSSVRICNEYAIPYLNNNLDVAKKLSALVGQDYMLSGVGAPDNRYLLIKTNPLWKEKIKAGIGKRGIDRIIKKYDNRHPKKQHLTVKELREKAYDKYMRIFKQSGYSFGDTRARNDLLDNWDIESTIRDILKQKAVTAKNVLTFVDLLNHLNTIPDDIAESIIRYFKLNTPSPQMSLVLLKMLGKNTKLTKALLKNFNYIKKAKYRDDYYAVAALILKKNVNNISPVIWTKYASITGDYNGTFVKMSKVGKRANKSNLAEKKRTWDNFIRQEKAFIKRLTNSKTPEAKKLLIAVEKSLKNPGWYPPSILTDNSYLRDCVGLTSEGSNLNEQNARLVFSTTINFKKNYKPEPRFGKLLQNKHLVFKNSVSLPFGACFPFESLTSKGQKTLFKTYSDIMKKRGYIIQKAVLKKLLCIKSPKYRKKTIKLLIGIKSQQVDKALQSISLEWLPELLKIAASNDPILEIKACQLIGGTSILGKSAVPTLKKLLQTKDNFSIKIASICALAEIGDKSSIPLIKKYYTDKNKLLVRAAKQAVYLLQPMNPKDKFFSEMLRTKPKRRR